MKQFLKKNFFTKEFTGAELIIWMLFFPKISNWLYTLLGGPWYVQ